MAVHGVLRSHGGKPSVDAKPCILISHRKIFPEEVAQAVEPAQGGGHLAFLAHNLPGGVINSFLESLS